MCVLGVQEPGGEKAHTDEKLEPKYVHLEADIVHNNALQTLVSFVKHFVKPKQSIVFCVLIS